MQLVHKFIFIILSLSLSLTTYARLEVGKKPPEIVLEGDLGGRVDGTPWRSADMKGKVFVLFYVAPSQKDLNHKATEAIKAAKFPEGNYQSIAVVNMKSSWWPDFLIKQKIKASQEEYKRTLYVRDRESVLVKKWNLKDHSSAIVVLSHTGEVLYSFDGQLQEKDIQELLNVIRVSLAKVPDSSAKISTQK